MNTQEFAEWLRRESDKFYLLANELQGDAERRYRCGYMRGCSMGLQKALDQLIKLDSSHDLTSTKG